MTGLDLNKSSHLTIRLFQDGNQFFENKFSKKSICVGRETSVDLIIEDRSISRKHMQIELIDGRTYVTDLESSNGTFVNNEKISTKTEVRNQTHIRIGKIIIQIISPELEKVKFDNLKNVPDKKEEEAPDLTLTRIALQLEAAIEKVEVRKPAEEHTTEEIKALLDKNFIELMTSQHESLTTCRSKKIESLVLWNGQIYKIQEFSYYETIVVGPTYDDSIHIPSLPFRWSLSTYDLYEAIFRVPQNLNVFVFRGQYFLSKRELLKEKRIIESPLGLQIQISHYDILRIEIDANTQLYFRYIPSSVDLDKKKMFTPEVLMKKAVLGSFILHFILAFLLLLIPQEKLQPKIIKPPERIAKLLVEEKPAVILPQPPPPLPPPEEKKVEPPKPKPKPKPKPIVEPPPKPVEKVEVVQKPVQEPVQKPVPQPTPIAVQKAVEAKPADPVVATPVVVAPKPTPPPPPPPVDISKLGALAAMSGLKMDAKSNKTVTANVYIAANTNTTTTSDLGTTAITSELKSQSATLAASNSSASSGPIKTKGTSSIGGSNYGTAELGTGTGQRGVKALLVGKPSLTAGKSSGKPEGLSREQVLTALQAYLGKIQSCYERSLLSDPNLSGRIEFEWNIKSSGSVTTVDVKKNSVAGGEQLGECVTAVLKSIKFPTATNGEETNPSIGFPFGRL